MWRVAIRGWVGDSGDSVMHFFLLKIDWPVTDIAAESMQHPDESFSRVGMVVCISPLLTRGARGIEQSFPRVGGVADSEV